MRLRTLLLASTLLLGCDARAPGSKPGAIINGHRDDGDPAVVALLHADGFPYCTGTLIAPQVVVTAAHCIVMDGKVVMPAKVAFGTDARNPTATIDVAWVEPQPHYGGRTFFNDAALVGLAKESDVAPMPFRRAPLGANDVNRQLRFVGFGLDENNKAGIKNEGAAPLKTLDPEFLIYGQVTCNGDSGGPAFLDNGAGGEELVGLTSHGPISCATFGDSFSTRVDAVAQWIESRIVTPCDTCQLDGRCMADCADDPDCACPADGVCASCSNRDDPDCTLGAINDPCDGAGTCEPGSFCVEGVCLQACEADRFGACSTTEFCGFGTGESRSVCFTQESLQELHTGCSASPDPRCAGLLAFALALGLRRRSRARRR